MDLSQVLGGADRRCPGANAEGLRAKHESTTGTGALPLSDRTPRTSILRLSWNIIGVYFRICLRVARGSYRRPSLSKDQTFETSRSSGSSSSPRDSAGR